MVHTLIDMEGLGVAHMETDVEEHVKLQPKVQTRKPRMYKVVLLNDDFTPMDFVVEVLMRFFRKSEAEATQVMLEVHQKGAGVCGVFTRDIAETKADSVITHARAHDHPLQCVTEPEQADNKSS